MKWKLRLLPDARAEFDAAADWYQQQRRGLGREFVRAVRDVFQRISANPRTHAKVYGDVRKAVVTRFPFVILYEDEGNEVLIIAVFHTARDPAAWQSRLH